MPSTNKHKTAIEENVKFLHNILITIEHGYYIDNNFLEEELPFLGDSIRDYLAGRLGRCAKTTLIKALEGSEKEVKSLKRKYYRLLPFYSRDDLEERGWTKKLIKDKIPPADLIVVSTANNATPVWRSTTIEKLENTYQFISHTISEGIIIDNLNAIKWREQKIKNLTRKRSLTLTDFAGRAGKRKKVRDKISKKRYIRNRNFIYNYKLNKECVDCKKTFDPSVLQFDHLPQFTKIKGISKLVGQASIKQLEEEISKCEIVCVNCHRLRTFNRHKEKIKARTYPKREKLQAYVDSTKFGKVCGDCKLTNLEPCQLDYHHIDPSSKIKTIAALVQKQATLRKIKKEIQKCELLCANCHALKTSEELNYRKHINV